MSDIAFLLIIFFVVAGKFTRSNEKEVALPAVELGAPNEPRDIELVVTKDGTYYVNGSRVEADGLSDELSSYIIEDAGREGRTVALFADRDAQYKDVAAAVEAVNQADAYLELAVNYTD